MPHDEREFCQILRQPREEHHRLHSPTQTVPHSLFLGYQRFHIRLHEPGSPETQKRLVDLQLVEPLHIHSELELESDCADGGDEHDGGEGAENEGIGVLLRRCGHVSVGADEEVADADGGASDVLSRSFRIPSPKEGDYGEMVALKSSFRDTDEVVVVVAPMRHLSQNQDHVQGY